MDINLPYYDGFYWCSKIRQVSGVPVLFISSRDSDGDKIRAITQGGDDYLEKPFRWTCLLPRYRQCCAGLIHTGSGFEHGSIRGRCIGPGRNEGFYGEKEIKLTPNECRILFLLMRDGGKVVTRTRLIRALWDDESFVDDNTLTVNVNRLRRN